MKPKRNYEVGGKLFDGETKWIIREIEENKLKIVEEGVSDTIRKTFADNLSYVPPKKQKDGKGFTEGGYVHAGKTNNNPSVNLCECEKLARSGRLPTPFTCWKCGCQWRSGGSVNAGKPVPVNAKRWIAPSSWLEIDFGIGDWPGPRCVEKLLNDAYGSPDDWVRKDKVEAVIRSQIGFITDAEVKNVLGRLGIEEGTATT